MIKFYCDMCHKEMKSLDACRLHISMLSIKKHDLNITEDLCPECYKKVKKGIKETLNLHEESEEPTLPDEPTEEQTQEDDIKAENKRLLDIIDGEIKKVYETEKIPWSKL